MTTLPMRPLLALLALPFLLAAPGRQALAMPYVPQSVGTYDTLYDNLDAARCRACHGTDTGDLHHASAAGLACTDCHTSLPEVVHDCLACHTQEAAQTASGPLERGHHVSSLAASGQCSACHDPALVSYYGAVPPPTAPIDSTTPCPENCRSCHKATTALQPPLAGLDGPGPENLHHSPGGAVVNDLTCDTCHDTSLPHYDQRQIRVCESCHPVQLLHAAHPADSCPGCHTQLTRLVYITRAYTADGAGNETAEFASGSRVWFHITYDVVGKPSKQYLIKAVVEAFGQRLVLKRYRYPGQGYEAVLSAQLGTKARPGAVKLVVYKLKMKRNGVLRSSDKATGTVTILAP